MNERRDPSAPDRRRTLARPGGRRASDPQAEWVNISLYAERYGISRYTVYKWLDAKVLRFYEAPGVLRIRNLPPDEHAALLALEHNSPVVCASVCVREISSSTT